MMAEVILDRDYCIGDVDDRLYGSFLEHVGRAVYEGIYDPESPFADEEGFRMDVLEMVRDLQIPLVRYPGGNFVSNFDWEDSVGPAEQRKRRMDLSWGTVETNRIGVGEMERWAKKAGTDIMMTVNLGTRGISDALHLLEYCNGEADTLYADRRRENGDDRPYRIRTWCLGNEMDGDWQIGHKEAREYGRLAAECAKAMKAMDPSIETCVCGSSEYRLKTFGSWDLQVLMETYDCADYISLHQYFGNPEGDTNEYLAGGDDLEAELQAVISICDVVKGIKHSKKTMNISFDEWNVWYHSKGQDFVQPWSEHPHLLEDVYNFEDAILDGLVLIRFLQHADRVKIACLAQLVNVIAPIMTEKDGGAWKQTIYYPFWYTSRFGRGKSMQCAVSCGRHDSSGHADVTDVEAAAVWNKEKGELAVFAVNRNTQKDIPLKISLQGFKGYNLRDHAALESADWNLANSAGAQNVQPVHKMGDTLEEGVFRTVLQPVSWHCVVFGCRKNPAYL